MVIEGGVVRIINLIAGVMLFCLLGAGGVAAQNTTVSCRAFLRVALDNATTSCAGLGNDQICYGNTPVSAVPQQNITEFNFDTLGSVESVENLQSMRVETLDFTLSEYGIAYVNLHAGIPVNSGDNTRIVLFGDAEITNAVDSLVTLEMRVNTPINVRVGPYAEEGLAGSRAVGETVIATGRTVNDAGEEWIRIDFQEHRSRIGWIIGWALNSDEDRNQLPVVDANDVIFSPMQAFNVRTGMNDAPCDPAPDSGIFIQTPPAFGPLAYTVNGALLELNGTVFIQTDDAFLYISNLGGDASVWADGSKQIIPVGSLTRIPIGVDGSVADAPVFPEGYNLPGLELLPYELLSQPVQLVSPLAPSEIVEALAPEAFPQDGLWTVSGDVNGCFPSSDSPAVLHSDYFLGTGMLTFAEDQGSFTFTGGSGGTSTHTRVAPNTYFFSTSAFDGTTNFTTTIVDAKTLVTTVEFSFVAGGGNCTSGATWTWSPVEAG